MGERPRVLVLGGPETDTSALLEGITGKPPGVRGEPLEWVIDTPYYTAAVEVCAPPEGFIGTTLDDTTLSGVEALVILFDARSEGSFKAARDWYESGAQELECLEIRLFVADNMDAVPEDARPAWLEDAARWCAAELLEYAEVAPRAPDLDARLELDGDAMGLRRVRAALVAHVWPGLSMKDSPARGGAGSMDPDYAEGPGDYEPPPLVVEGDSLQEEGVARSPEPAENGGARSDREASGDVASSHDARGAPDLQNGDVAPDSEADGSPIERAGASPAAALLAEMQAMMATEQGALTGDSGEDENGDAQLDMLQRLMEQMSGMRGAVAGLPDAQRHQVAAEIALQMAGMLGLDESASDDDPSE